MSFIKNVAAGLFLATVSFVPFVTGQDNLTPLQRQVMAFTDDVVKNVRASGKCSMRTLGHDVRLVEPRLVTDPTRRLVPPPVRLAGRILGVTEFLVMRAVPHGARPPG